MNGVIAVLDNSLLMCLLEIVSYEGVWFLLVMVVMVIVLAGQVGARRNRDRDRDRESKH